MQTLSVVIVGGNERMERQYTELCRQYSCKAKVFTKTSGGVRSVGSPDLIVLFTGTVSHKMLRSLECETKGMNIPIARSHTSSITALKNILEEHTGGM
mgnify:FL=1